MRSESYLKEIREAAGLKRAVLKKIVVEGNRATFYLVTDLSYRQEDVALAGRVTQRYVPAGFEGDVSVMKSVPSAEGVRATVLQILKNRFPAAAAFISPEDIDVKIDGAGGRFFLSVDEGERAQFAAGDVLNVLTAELSRNFCGSWIGDFRTAEREEREIEHAATPPAEVLVAPRVFPVEHFAPIDGAEVKTALCIADLKGEAPAVTLCGELVHLEERTTKNNKPYFRVTVRDGSGEISGSYFSKKSTVEKVRALKAGDSICLTGTNELFNGAFRFTVNKIDYGTPPEGYVVKKTYRPVPAAYVAVRPEPISDLVQGDMFGNAALPESFCTGKFVVFDLETTGLSHSPAGGAMDRIIEIGAAKIENGGICARFSTLVACPVRLSEEIVGLTGINDEMLVGAPQLKDVIADFYKFCDGCALVAHNVGFDSAFIRYYGEQEGFLFSHRLYDTVEFARQTLDLKNYKLDTIADHFRFTFNHHRAFDDAFVTAKIFIELVRQKGALPAPFAF